jgi:hypothetical protein
VVATKPGDVAAAVRRAIEAGYPSVIEAITDPYAFPPGASSRLRLLDDAFGRE